MPGRRLGAPGWSVLVAALALLAIACAVWQLERASHGLSIHTQRLGDTPVTVFRPAAAAAEPAPVVLIAHGFAGSQQLMQPLAQTLARNGFIAITFDFPGHGRNTAPLRGGVADQQASLRTLVASMVQLGALARSLSGSAQRYAVVGHSMASDIVVRHAQAHAGAVQATVGISLFASTIRADTPADSPRNLLAIVGALEPAMLVAEARRVLAPAASASAPAAALDTTTGRFADGTARRATLSPGVEHIGVLYSAHTGAQTLAWLNAAFGRPVAAQPFIDARGPWLGLLLLGVVALAWPLSRCLPRLAAAAAPGQPRRRWWGWRGQWLPCVLPAIATPLLLWKLPADWLPLPLLLGDHLLLHFGLYGLLTLALLWLAGQRLPGLAPGRGGALLLAMLLASAWGLLAVGVPLDRYVFNIWPEAARLPLIAALLVGTVPYFLGNEWLARGAGAPRGAAVASKLCFLLSLVLSIALNPQRLFFLAILIPAILLLFVIYGLFSRWLAQATGHPVVAATANAVVFACFIAVTFPLVG